MKSKSTQKPIDLDKWKKVPLPERLSVENHKVKTEDKKDDNKWYFDADLDKDIRKLAGIDKKKTDAQSSVDVEKTETAKLCNFKHYLFVYTF